jgi:hypothetical protein
MNSVGATVAKRRRPRFKSILDQYPAEIDPGDQGRENKRNHCAIRTRNALNCAGFHLTGHKQVPPVQARPCPWRAIAGRLPLAAMEVFEAGVATTSMCGYSDHEQAAPDTATSAANRAMNESTGFVLLSQAYDEKLLSNDNRGELVK